jgi:hypothetical protein
VVALELKLHADWMVHPYTTSGSVDAVDEQPKKALTLKTMNIS